MAGAKRVVFRFVSAQKTADAAVLLDRRQKIAAAGQYFVRVGLMTNVPDQPIVRRVERVVHGDRQLDGPERCSGVAADACHGFENVTANFVGDFLELIDFELPQIRRRVDVLKKFHPREIVNEPVIPQKRLMFTTR